MYMSPSVSTDRVGHVEPTPTKRAQEVADGHTLAPSQHDHGRYAC
jgi:hypothetical protein